MNTYQKTPLGQARRTTRPSAEAEERHRAKAREDNEPRPMRKFPPQAQATHDGGYKFFTTYTVDASSPNAQTHSSVEPDARAADLLPQPTGSMEENSCRLKGRRSRGPVRLPSR